MQKNIPLHGMMRTTEGQADLDTARTVLRRYELRWWIERFFHALRVGPRIEDLCLDEADGLRKYLAFDAITAFRVRDPSSRPARSRTTRSAERSPRTTSGNSVPSPPTMASRCPGDRRR